MNAPMKQIAIMLVVLLAAVFGACDDDSGTNTAAGDIDPRLACDWYGVDSLWRFHPSPPLSHRGLRFGYRDSLLYLGVDFETGKLALLATHLLGLRGVELLQARDGLLIVRYFCIPGGIATDTMRYSVCADTLTVTDGIFAGTYRRSCVGCMVTEPIHSVVTVRVNNVVSHAPSVAHVPSAYASMWDASTLYLWAELPRGWLHITVNNFAGPGTYDIVPGSCSFEEVDGDSSWGFLTESQPPHSITIEQFDAAAHRCQGRFDFTAVHDWYPSSVIDTLRFTEGSFSVPVYD